MGTRADFYVKLKSKPAEAPKLEWIGSVAFDGYPEGFEDTQAELQLLSAQNEAEFRASAKEVFSKRNDATLPEMGWPWRWEDSLLTDFAYVFDKSEVKAFCLGRPFDMKNTADEADQKTEKVIGYFPNMKHVQNVNFGARSGAIFIPLNPEK